jgi:hypothetical protein
VQIVGAAADLYVRGGDSSYGRDSFAARQLAATYAAHVVFMDPSITVFGRSCMLAASRATLALLADHTHVLVTF